jgi:hypothetical protein
MNTFYLIDTHVFLLNLISLPGQCVQFIQIKKHLTGFENPSDDNFKILLINGVANTPLLFADTLPYRVSSRHHRYPICDSQHGNLTSLRNVHGLHTLLQTSVFQWHTELC